MHIPATVPSLGLMPNAGFSAEAYIAARVFAPRIPRVRQTVAGTNVSIVENALGYILSVPTVTVADAGGDTTTWPMLATSQTGNMTVATDGDLTYNAATGTLSATAFSGAVVGSATQITVANEAADTTCFPVFVTDATGDVSPKTNTGFGYNAATNTLTATTFTGALVGNADTATSATSATTASSAATLTTPRTIGGVSFDGSANIVPQTIQSVNEATDTTCFPLFISASGTQSLQPLNNAGFTYNSSTNALTATTFIGALSGNATSATSAGSATNATNATNIGVTDAAGDTTTWVLLAGAQTGTQGALTDGGLTYDANSNALTATTFVGALTGNADTATSATSATSANTAGSAATLTTPRTIGGVSFDGSANIVPETIASVNEATDTTCFPLFITASGTQSLQPKNNVGLTYNSNTNNLTATTFTGALAGNATSATSATSATTATTATVGTTTTVANEATDTTCFVNFTTAATGDLGVKTNANLTFNSNTGILGGGGTNLELGGSATLKQARVVHVASAVNYLAISGGVTTSAPRIIARGTDTDVSLLLASQAAGGVRFFTGGTSDTVPGVEQVRVTHTASATRYIDLTGSNGGNPTINVSAGSLAITPAIVAASSISAVGGRLSRNITTQTGATYTVAAADTHIIANRAGTITVTLPTATLGQELHFLTITANAVVSASSNVIPKTGAAASTAILPATDGAWATLVANGTQWQIINSGV